MYLFFPNMDLFISYYQLILIPLCPVLWDYKVPVFEVPIMGTFTYSDAHPDDGCKQGLEPQQAPIPRFCPVSIRCKPGECVL